MLLVPKGLSEAQSQSSKMFKCNAWLDVAPSFFYLGFHLKQQIHSAKRPFNWSRPRCDNGFPLLLWDLTEMDPKSGGLSSAYPMQHMPDQKSKNYRLTAFHTRSASRRLSITTGGNCSLCRGPRHTVRCGLQALQSFLCWDFRAPN